MSSGQILRNRHRRRSFGANIWRKRAFVVLLILAASCLAAVSAAQDETWVGRRVMVIGEEAQFRAQGQTSTRAPLGMVLEVSHVNGPWLWFQGEQGWIHERYIVPHDEAIDYFTAQINRNPSAQAYHHRGIAHVSLSHFDEAVDDFSECIRRDANNVAAYNDRGNALLKLGLLDQALQDFSALIERPVRHPAVYTNRGLVWHAKGDYDRALADYNAALAIDGRFAPAWDAGGAAREAQGDFPKAISNYRRAIEFDPEFVRALNNLAWILATNPEPELRSGQEAVKLATKACEWTGYQDAGYLDTLAAALAETAQFDEAITRASQAVQQAAADRKPQIEARLELYRSGQPYRDQ
jgi:tetratricopeptide (TPR) repeat protein